MGTTLSDSRLEWTEEAQTETELPIRKLLLCLCSLEGSVDIDSILAPFEEEEVFMNDLAGANAMQIH